MKDETVKFATITANCVGNNLRQFYEKR